MSVKAMQWYYEIARAVAEIPARHLMVLGNLCWHHNAKTGACFPSQEEIAKETHLPRQKVNEYIKALQECGLIKIIKCRKSGKILRNKYELFGSYKRRPPCHDGVTRESASAMSQKKDKAPCHDGVTRAMSRRGDSKGKESITRDFADGSNVLFLSARASSQTPEKAGASELTNSNGKKFDGSKNA